MLQRELESVSFAVLAYDHFTTLAAKKSSIITRTVRIELSLIDTVAILRKRRIE